MCYIESLRIFPTIGFISMDVRKKSTCPFSLLKKKITISVDLFKAQTNKKYWNNPFDFDPNRYSTEKNKLKEAFYPFGLGERECIGKAFSFDVTISLLQELLKTFNIEILDKENVKLQRLGPFFLLLNNTLLTKIEYK